MPTLPNPNGQIIVFSQQHVFCDVRLTWDSQWVFQPHLQAIRATESVAPEVPTADFIYHFGRIIREGTTSFSNYSVQNLRDYYVRIRVQSDADEPQVVWVGIISDQESITDRDAESGDEAVRAFGLAHLFDREGIRNARVNNGSGTMVVDWVPTFNDRHITGLSHFGNRSSGTNADGVYEFSQGAQKWNNQQIVEYLLEYHKPDNLTVNLGGQAEALAELEYVVKVHDGGTLWTALNKLIDRRIGLGFYLSVDAAAETGGDVEIVVFTVTDTDITFGEKTIPANAFQGPFLLPSENPWDHLLDRTGFRVTTLNIYDEAYILGERIMVTATFAHEDRTIEPNWSDDLEEDYVFINLGDEHQNDVGRSSDHFAKVFVQHIVPKAWNWMAGNGEGGAKVNCALTPNEDGSIDHNTQAGYWTYGTRFERHLPIREGYDFSVSPPTNTNEDDAEPDFMPALAFYKDGEVAGFSHNHDATNLWIRVDRLTDVVPDLRSFGLRPLDKEMGFELTCNPRHYVAAGFWPQSAPEASPTNHEPDVAYPGIIYTAQFRTHQRQQIILKGLGTSATDAKKRLVVYVDGAEYWYIVPGTVIGTSSTMTASLNTLKRIHPDNCVVRDDKDKLEAVAAFVKAWYGVPRQTVSLPIKRLGRYVELGSLITELVGVGGQEGIRTVLTTRTMDFVQRMTVLETGWAALDFGAATEGDVREEPAIRPTGPEPTVRKISPSHDPNIMFDLERPMPTGEGNQFSGLV